MKAKVTEKKKQNYTVHLRCAEKINIIHWTKLTEVKLTVRGKIYILTTIGLMLRNALYP